MVPVHVIELDTSLFEAVALIAKHDCVLVKDEANKTCGVMTSYDVSETFVNWVNHFFFWARLRI